MEALESAVQDELNRLREPAADSEVLRVRFAEDGSWIGPPLEGRSESAGKSDSHLLTSLRSQLVKLQEAGEIERAIERLRAIIDRAADESTPAWALEKLYALLADANQPQEARAAAHTLLDHYPDVRDARGLKRSFVVRFKLVREGAPADDWLDLFEEVVADHTHPSQTATDFFKGLVRAAMEEHLATEPDLDVERFQAILKHDAERGRRRRLLAALPAGISDWVARGAPGGWSEFALPATADASTEASTMVRADLGQDRIALALQPEGDGWIGAALEVSALFEGVAGSLARDPTASALGFAPWIVDEAGASLALTPEHRVATDAPVIELQSLPRPLTRYSAVVRGGDREAFLAAESRRRWITAALVSGALVAALLAVVATLRAVSREGRAAAEREAFVAAVTHELKAPLASIRVLAEVLEGGDVEPDVVRDFGARTVQESDRLSRLVDTVLDLASIEHDAKSLQREQVELGALADRVSEDQRERARTLGFEIDVQHNGQPLIVQGDQNALESALANLLDNALKHSDRPHRIEVRVESSVPGEVELAILDRGRGVARADQERIFDPFTRLGDEETRDRPGVGLGLALVRRIVQAHGGRVELRSRAGGGSRFSIHLPLVPPPLPEKAVEA